MSRSTLTILCMQILIVMSLSACRDNHPDRVTDLYASLEESDMLSIPLDSMTTQTAAYYQLVNDSVLAFLNGPTFEICLYNMRSNTMEKVGLQKDGPESVLGAGMFYYISPDSIWLFSSWNQVVTLVNKDGKILERKKIPEPTPREDGVEYAVIPMATATTPYIVKDGIHYLGGFHTRRDKDKTSGVTLVYDESADKSYGGNPYPKVYDQGEGWGTFSYLVANYTMMPKGEMLIDYPASDSLYIYNFKDNTRKAVFAGYSQPTDIRPRNLSTPDDTPLQYLEEYAYAGIFYDKDKEVYYRFVRLPMEVKATVEDLYDEVPKKPITVIILDKDLNKIGETALPEGSYYPLNTFVNSDGLHIKTLSDDDNFMTFRVFKLKQ